MSGVGEMATRLEASQGALMDALDGITEAELHTPPSEGEWTVAEICAHVIEMQPLWAGKAARIEDRVRPWEDAGGGRSAHG